MFRSAYCDIALYFSSSRCARQHIYVHSNDKQKKNTEKISRKMKMWIKQQKIEASATRPMGSNLIWMRNRTCFFFIWVNGWRSDAVLVQQWINFVIYWRIVNARIIEHYEKQTNCLVFLSFIYLEISCAQLSWIKFNAMLLIVQVTQKRRITTP